MNIELQEIAVRELVAGYEDKGDEGVVGYGGKLDIRPAYQREFIYKDKQREAVVDSVMNGFPLNVMYWARREDGSFEVMDGQQRTISLCQFAAGDDNTRLEAYERQHGICPLCGAHFELARWRPTTSPRGAMAAAPSPPTARCSARTATGARERNDAALRGTGGRMEGRDVSRETSVRAAATAGRRRGRGGRRGGRRRRWRGRPGRGGARPSRRRGRRPRPCRGSWA